MARHPDNGALLAFLRAQQSSPSTSALVGTACEALARYPRRIENVADAERLLGFEDDVVDLVEGFFALPSHGIRSVPRSPLEAVASNTAAGSASRRRHSPAAAASAVRTGARGCADAAGAGGGVVVDVLSSSQSSMNPSLSCLDCDFDLRPLSERMADRSASLLPTKLSTKAVCGVGVAAAAAAPVGKPPLAPVSSSSLAATRAAPTLKAVGRSHSTGAVPPAATSAAQPAGAATLVRAQSAVGTGVSSSVARGAAGHKPTSDAVTNGSVVSGATSSAARSGLLPFSTSSGSVSATVAAGGSATLVASTFPDVLTGDAARTATRTAPAISVSGGGGSVARARSIAPAAASAASTTSTKVPPPPAPPETWTCGLCSNTHIAIRPLTADGSMRLDPAAWELVLLLDNREVRSRSNRSYIQSALLTRGVNCEVRQLPLGDITWVIRRRATDEDAGIESVGGAGAMTSGGLVRSGSSASGAARGVTGIGSLAGLMEVDNEDEHDNVDEGDSDSGSTSEDIGTHPPAGVPKRARTEATATVAGASASSSGATKATKPAKKKKGKAAHGSDDDASTEFVTDFIVERKQVSDLVASIKDGRYSEQKQRLGITGQRVTYLVEGDPEKVNSAEYGARVGTQHVRTALISTQIISHCRVVTTTTVDATVSWLVSMDAAISGMLFCNGRRGAAVTRASSVGAGASASATSALGDGISGESGSASILRLAATGAPASTSSGYVSSTSADGDAYMMASQTVAQVAAIESHRVVWPVGGGMAGSTSSASGTSSAARGTAGSAARSGSSSARGGASVSHACSSDRCSLWGTRGLHPATLTYAAWATMAAKPRLMTALSMFGRCLRQVPGCSADRAQAVLDAYPTPALLLDAYDAHHTAAASTSVASMLGISVSTTSAASKSVATSGVDMLRGLLVPNQKNTLGPAISRTMCSLYCDTEYAPAAAAASTASAAAVSGGSTAGRVTPVFDADDDELGAFAAAAMPPPRSGSASSTGGNGARGRGGFWRGRGRGGRW